MTQVQILIPGYAKEIEGGWRASSTVTLIKDLGKNIIVDPGINRPLLLEKLKQQKLTPKDIDIVFLTHYHPDHAFLAAIFRKALILDGDIIYKNDLETPYEKSIPGTNIQVIPTPGHAHEHFSLSVKLEKGITVVAGDLWWWTDNQKQDASSTEALLKHPDPFVKDPQALQKSRQKILRIADYIIPGHGQMFKNPTKTKNLS